MGRYAIVTTIPAYALLFEAVIDAGGENLRQQR